MGQDHFPDIEADPESHWRGVPSSPAERLLKEDVALGEDEMWMVLGAFRGIATGQPSATENDVVKFLGMKHDPAPNYVERGKLFLVGEHALSLYSVMLSSWLDTILALVCERGKLPLTRRTRSGWTPGWCQYRQAIEKAI